MKRPLVVMTVLLAVTVPSHRPNAADAPGPLAVELSRLVMPRESWDRTRRATTEQLRQYFEATIQQAGATIPPEFPDRFAEEFGRIYSYEEMLDIQAGLLAKHYTVSELRELLAFYRTPLGKKAIHVMPEVVADSNGQVMALLQQRMPALMERLRPLFEAARPGAAAPPAEAPASKAPSR